MGDAALKLARRALAGGGTDSCTNAVNVLNYYVEREEGVASDTRVWAALHYLYAQMEDEQGSRRCLKKIEALGGAPPQNTPAKKHYNKKRQSISRTSTTTTTSSSNMATAANPKRLSLVCGNRRSPSPESKRKFMDRLEEKRAKSRMLRQKGSELFDSTNTNTSTGAYVYGGKVDGLLWKSRLLQARGRLLVEGSQAHDIYIINNNDADDDSRSLFEGSTQSAPLSVASRLETPACSSFVSSKKL